MSLTRLDEAARELRLRYGNLPRWGEPHAWKTLVRLVAARGLREDVWELRWRDLEESPLQSAEGTAACSLAEIIELLTPLGRAKQTAPTLLGLARWWNAKLETDGEVNWQRPLEELQEELRQIRGVSIELADRVLLFVGERTVFPVDRAAMRIVCRHGWLGPEADYEEWQSFFASGVAGTETDLQSLSLWMGKVGEEHCGPRPRCEGCPLQPLLPEGGPYEPDP